MPVIHEIQMVQMGEVDTRQHILRQPPQLGSKKEQELKAFTYVNYPLFKSWHESESSCYR